MKPFVTSLTTLKIGYKSAIRFKKYQIFCAHIVAHCSLIAAVQWWNDWLLCTWFPVYAINVSIVKTIQPGCLILLHSLGPIMLPCCQILVALSVVSFMYQRYVKLLSTTVTIPNGKCLHLTQILDHQLPLNQSSGGSCLLEFSSCTMPSHKILTI